MALGTLRTAERASVIHLSPMFLVAEITISSFHPSGRVDGSRISQNLLSKQAVRIQNIFAKISWEFRWTRVSNIAKDSDALVYTTRLPLELHLPPNRRAPSPSKQVEALSSLDDAKACDYQAYTPYSIRPRRSSTSLAPTSVSDNSKGVFPPRAFFGSVNHL